jgi:hypothetical protein
MGTMKGPMHSSPVDSAPVDSAPISSAIERAPYSFRDEYTVWLSRQRVPLVTAGGTVWRRYFEYSALVQASAKPEPVELTHAQAMDLLRESGTHLLRYFSRTFEEPTQFWYVVCDRYDFEDLPTKLKTKIRRAYKDCVVRALDASWLAANGYECYTAAFSRYKNGVADSREMFEEKCLSCVDGPFRFWGVFVGNVLASYAKAIVGEDYVTLSVFKIHPGFPSSRPAYALMDAVLREYVIAAKKTVNNGFRSLNHDTNMQDFVLQFGFRKVHCDLQVVYRRPLEILIGLLYPLKPLIDRAPASRVLTSVKALLRQEEIRRSFLSPDR